MARKQSDDSSNQATTPENGQSAPTPSRREAVREAIANGMSSPTEIAAHLKTAYGLDITTAHVSTIKTALKKKKKRKGRKPGRKAKAEKQAAKEPVAKPVPPAKEGGLTAQDLRLLTELASKAGGFSRLREFIDVLRDVR